MTGIVLDIIVVVLVALLLIFGIWRGMYKLIFGLVSSLLTIILAIVFISPVTGFLVDRTTLDERLGQAIDEPLTKSVPNGEIIIEYLDVDGDGILELGYSADGVLHPFADLLAGTNFSMFSGVVESVLSGQVEEGQNVTFINALSSTLVGYIIMAISFVALLIIFAIVVRLIMLLVKKLVTKTYVGHFINKLFGAILGIVISMVIIWGTLAIIKLLGTYEWIIPVNTLISESTLTKLLFDNNFIYNFLMDSFNIKEVIDSIIASAASIGG